MGIIGRKLSEFRRKSQRVLKVFFILFVVTSWLLSGWPRVPFTQFPPKIEETKATFSGVTARGSATDNSNSNQITVSPDANITVGKIAIVTCVSDNNDTTNGATNFHTISDSQTNTWTKAYEETDSDGAADDGSTTSLWWTKVTTEIGTGNSIACNLGTSKTDKIISVFEVTVGSGNTVATQVGIPSHSDSATSLSNTLSSLTSREYLFVGNFGGEGEDTAKTNDTQYTELFDLVSATAGQDHVNVQSHVQYRIVTATGDTVDSTAVTFTNATQTLVAFYEVAEPTPTFTQNDFRWYENADSVTLSDLWGTAIVGDNEDVPVVPAAYNPPGIGEQMRLQINITVSTVNLPKTTQAFKLQYKAGTDQDCSTGSWTDIGAKGSTTAAWRFFDNASLNDNATEVNQISTSDVAGGYSEINPTGTNPNGVNTGQDMEWDFPIESVDGQVVSATTYAFRIVKSDDSVISYTSGDCPTVETEPGTANLMRHGNLFVDGVEKGFFWAE